VIIAIMTNLPFGVGRGTPSVVSKASRSHGLADVMAITKWSIGGFYRAGVLNSAPSEKQNDVFASAYVVPDLVAALNYAAEISCSYSTQRYRDTGTIAFRTRVCSISAHAEAPPRLRAQQRSAMIASGSVGL
jgi:hypothetical protein